MPIKWGDLELKVQDLSLPPAELKIKEQELVPHSIEQPTPERLLILFAYNASTLAHKGIVPLSDKVIFKGDTDNIAYSRETDYVIDYTNGTIARREGGLIPDGVNLYITYSYYDYSPDTFLIPGVLMRQSYTMECYAPKASFDLLKSDRLNQIKKTLTLLDGSTLQAYITGIPTAKYKPGDLTDIWFSIIFTEG
jgi:hypothetical protein